VELAQQIVPHIEAAPDARDGVVENLREEKMKSMAEPGDFILCRTTAPLIECALSFIKTGKTAQVRGREIGSDLTNLINRVGASNDVGDFLTKLGEYEQVQAEKLNRMNKEQQLIALEDKVRCLRVLAEVNDSVEGMRQMITTMFVENMSKGITLMTVHKSKGLQAKRTFIIKPEQLPMKKNDPEEMRIKYVAVTRAQEELYFVNP
jgi:DNA helicase II / ATP-dependent DNA helicase PcrA